MEFQSLEKYFVQNFKNLFISGAHCFQENLMCKTNFLLNNFLVALRNDIIRISLQFAIQFFHSFSFVIINAFRFFKYQRIHSIFGGVKSKPRKRFIDHFRNRMPSKIFRWSSEHGKADLNDELLKTFKIHTRWVDEILF